MDTKRPIQTTNRSIITTVIKMVTKEEKPTKDFVRRMWNLEDCSGNIKALMIHEAKNELPVEMAGELLSGFYPELARDVFTSYSRSNLLPIFQKSETVVALVKNVAEYLQTNVSLVNRLTELEATFKSYEVLCQISTDFQAMLRDQKIQEERRKKP